MGRPSSSSITSARSTSGPGATHDVRPHPHIGLATVTYLFEGAIMHRDSTGVVQRIEPGADQLDDGRARHRALRAHAGRPARPARRSHGLQLWFALPRARGRSPRRSSTSPRRHSASWAWRRVRARLVGSAFGSTSPVATLRRRLAIVLDFDVAAGRRSSCRRSALSSHAAATDHPFEIDGARVDEFAMAIVATGAAVQIAAPRGGRVVAVGGEPLGHSFLSWNFVASRRELHPRGGGQLAGAAL